MIKKENKFLNYYNSIQGYKWIGLAVVIFSLAILLKDFNLSDIYKNMLHIDTIDVRDFKRDQNNIFSLTSKNNETTNKSNDDISKKSKYLENNFRNFSSEDVNDKITTNKDKDTFYAKSRFVNSSKKLANNIANTINKDEDSESENIERENNYINNIKELENEISILKKELSISNSISNIFLRLSQLVVLLEGDNFYIDKKNEIEEIMILLGETNNNDINQLVIILKEILDINIKKDEKFSIFPGNQSTYINRFFSKFINIHKVSKNYKRDLEKIYKLKKKLLHIIFNMTNKGK